MCGTCVLYLCACPFVGRGGIVHLHTNAHAVSRCGISLTTFARRISGKTGLRCPNILSYKCVLKAHLSVKRLLSNWAFCLVGRGTGHPSIRLQAASQLPVWGFCVCLSVCLFASLFVCPRVCLVVFLSVATGLTQGQQALAKTTRFLGIFYPRSGKAVPPTKPAEL